MKISSYFMFIFMLLPTIIKSFDQSVICGYKYERELDFTSGIINRTLNLILFCSVNNLNEIYSYGYKRSECKYKETTPRLTCKLDNEFAYYQVPQNFSINTLVKARDGSSITLNNLKNSIHLCSFSFKMISDKCDELNIYVSLVPTKHQTISKSSNIPSFKKKQTPIINNIVPEVIRLQKEKNYVLRLDEMKKLNKLKDWLIPEVMAGKTSMNTNQVIYDQDDDATKKYNIKSNDENTFFHITDQYQYEGDKMQSIVDEVKSRSNTTHEDINQEAVSSTSNSNENSGKKNGVEPNKGPGSIRSLSPIFPMNSRSGMILNNMLGGFHDSLLVLGTTEQSGLSENERIEALAHIKLSPGSLPESIHSKIKLNQASNHRKFALSLLEVHQRVTSLLSVGVTSKEVFALIVDAIMNPMPEIIVGLLVQILAPMLMKLLGRVLSCILPPILLPNSGAVPCIVAGDDGLPIPVSKQRLPTPDCACKGGKAPKFTPGTFFVQLEDGKSFAYQCPCDHPDAEVYVGSLLETKVTAYNNRDQIHANSGFQYNGGSGGAIAQMEPKIKVSVQNGISTQTTPALVAGLKLRLEESLLHDVKHSIYRNSGRSLTTSLTKYLTTSILKSLELEFDIGSKSTKLLSKSLIPSVIHSVVPVMALSLSHDPTSDYYCHYCSQHHLYCLECEASKSKDGDVVADAHHFSNVFGEYYGRYYSGEIADIICNQIFNDDTTDDTN